MKNNEIRTRCFVTALHYMIDRFIASNGDDPMNSLTAEKFCILLNLQSKWRIDDCTSFFFLLQLQINISQYKKNPIPNFFSSCFLVHDWNSKLINCFLNGNIVSNHDRNLNDWLANFDMQRIERKASYDFQMCLLLTEQSNQNSRNSNWVYIFC